MGGTVIRGPSGTLIVPSLAIVDDGEFTGTVQMSNEGTLDWYGASNFQSPPRSIAAATGVHTKAKGGYIVDTFAWVMGGGTLTTFTQADSLTAQSTASDSAGVAALNSSTFGGMHTPSGSHTGWGFKFSVPAALQERVLRLYLLTFSDIVTVTAKLFAHDDVAPVSVALDSGSGANAHRKVTINYKGVGQLHVSVLATTVHTGTANIKLGCITLAAS